MRTCTQCKKDKALVEFHNNAKRIDYECIECKKVRMLIHARTKKGLLATIVNRQKANSKRRGHIPPTYSKEEFFEAVLAMPLFHKLHKEWKDSGYLKTLSPSIDRIDDSRPYTEDNIQLMTWKENNDKASADMLNGNSVCKNSRAVQQLTLEGKVVGEYASPSLAARAVGLKAVESIRYATKPKRNGEPRIAGGYRWKWK